MIQDLASNINLNNSSELNENVHSNTSNEHIKDEFRSILNAISKDNEHVILNYEIEEEASDISLSNLESLTVNNDIEHGGILSSNIKISQESNDVGTIKSEKEAKDEIVKSEKDLSNKFKANSISLPNAESLTSKSNFENVAGSLVGINYKTVSTEIVGNVDNDDTLPINKITDNTNAFKTISSSKRTEIVPVQKQGQSSIIADNNDSSSNKILIENENLSTNFKKDKSLDLVKRERFENPSLRKENTKIYTNKTNASVASNINYSGTDERPVKIETDSKNHSKGSLKLNLSKSVENIGIVNKSIFDNAPENTPSTKDEQKVISPKDSQSKQLSVNAIGEQKIPSPNISKNLNAEIFNKPLVIQKRDIVSKNTTQFDQHSTLQSNIVFQDVSEVKSSELVQFIQENKSEIIPLKDAKKSKYALSMSEQGEARLKLLKESERIDVLPSRDIRLGEHTSHTLDKKIQFFSSTVGLSEEQEAILKELMVESFRGENQNLKEQNLLGYLRLSELPIVNASARRALTSNFAKILQQDMNASLKHNNEQWQKHSFRLEDGNNIKMSSKNIDGILHIKLAASNPELNRLLMSMEQEIREHLKEELSLELDLQFENNEQGAFSDALGNNSDKGNKNWKKKESELTDDNSNQHAVNSLEPTIRNFGYNQMEWIV
jgi:hypothetical protein